MKTLKYLSIYTKIALIIIVFTHTGTIKTNAQNIKNPGFQNFSGTGNWINKNHNIKTKPPGELPPKGLDSILTAQLQFTIDSLRILMNFKGVSACVNIPGHGVWQGVSGNSYGNLPLSSGMYFGIGSQTKTFISVLILKLAERNVLNLDDSIKKWLPPIQFVDSNITIRQLLNHTSGVFNFNDNPAYTTAINADLSRKWTALEIVSDFLEAPYFQPGESWHYSNTNYVLAGMIIESATDTPAYVLLRKHILDPAGLGNTFFDIREDIPDTIAHSWYQNFDYIVYPRFAGMTSIGTAGAMYSNSENMARWYQKLFNGEIINPASIHEMLTVVDLGNSVSYGLGIFRQPFMGHVFYFHGGDFWGYSSLTTIDSASGTSISVLTNEYPTNYYTITTALIADIDNYNVIGINSNNQTVPVRYKLLQNYPNPFNPSTVIKYDLSVRSNVSLKIYDILGREIETLVNRQLPPGTYRAEFNGSNLPSGVYFYRLVSGSFAETKKMILIK